MGSLREQQAHRPCGSAEPVAAGERRSESLVLALQAAAGNRAVARLVVQRDGPRTPGAARPVVDRSRWRVDPRAGWVFLPGAEDRTVLVAALADLVDALPPLAGTTVGVLAADVLEYGGRRYHVETGGPEGVVGLRPIGGPGGGLSRISSRYTVFRIVASGEWMPAGQVVTVSGLAPIAGGIVAYRCGTTAATPAGAPGRTPQSLSELYAAQRAFINRCEQEALRWLRERLRASRALVSTQAERYRVVPAGLTMAPPRPRRESQGERDTRDLQLAAREVIQRRRAVRQLAGYLRHLQQNPRAGGAQEQSRTQRQLAVAREALQEGERQASERHPLLGSYLDCGRETELEALADTGTAPRAAAEGVISNAAGMLRSIDWVAARLTPERVWALPGVVAHLREALRVAPGSQEEAWLRGRAEDVARDESFVAVASTVMTLVLSAVAIAVTAGGAAPVVVAAADAAAAAAGLAATALTVPAELDRLHQANTDPLRARRILGDADASWEWLALELALTPLDLVVAAARCRELIVLFRGARRAARMSSAAGAVARLRQAGEAARPGLGERLVQQLRQIVAAEERGAEVVGGSVGAMAVRLTVNDIMYELLDVRRLVREAEASLPLYPPARRDRVRNLLRDMRQTLSRIEREAPRARRYELPQLRDVLNRAQVRLEELATTRTPLLGPEGLWRRYRDVMRSDPEIARRIGELPDEADLPRLLAEDPRIAARLEDAARQANAAAERRLPEAVNEALELSQDVPRGTVPGGGRWALAADGREVVAGDPRPAYAPRATDTARELAAEMDHPADFVHHAEPQLIAHAVDVFAVSGTTCRRCREFLLRAAEHWGRPIVSADPELIYIFHPTRGMAVMPKARAAELVATGRIPYR
jgi:hypothetical protein